MRETAPIQFGDLSDTPLWIQIWQQKMGDILLFSLFLLVILVVMLFRDSLAQRKKMLNTVKYGVLAISFLYVGLVLKAQPTTTNIVIFVNSLKGFRFPLDELYMLEPFIFLSFVFILVTLIFWGRGVFCGWLCPYGALLELLNVLRDRVFPKVKFVLSEGIHLRLIYLKYGIFLIILGVSFESFMLSEYLTEVEPFRTLVLKWKREWYFNLYFFILTAGSVIIYRSFCRYLCPLGAALAIPSMVRKIPLIKMKRYDFCSHCKICTRKCSPQAITAGGGIDARECLTCLDCQVNFWDEDVCPVMVRKERVRTSRGC